MESSSSGVRASSLVLHIGPRKTGTTAIQQAFSDRRDALRPQGVVYPGHVRQHFMAVNRFIGRRQLWEEDHERPVSEEPFLELVEEMGDAPFGVISTEILSQARPHHIRRLVEGGSGRTPVVVITYRPFDQLLSSTWQQLVKEGLREPLETWSRRTVTDHPEQSDVPFPRILDLADLVDGWSSVVGVENIIVVVVDRARPGLISQAFEDLLELPEGSLTALQAEGRKRSLTAQEAELLLQVNRQLPRDKHTLKQHRHLLRTVAGWLDSHPPSPQDVPIGLPADVRAAAKQRSQDMVDRLAAHGGRLTVRGDLESLVADEPERPVPEGQDTEPTEVDLAMAASWLAGVITQVGTAEL